MPAALEVVDGADVHVELGRQLAYSEATPEAQLFEPARKPSERQFGLRHRTWTQPLVACRRRGNSTGVRRFSVTADLPALEKLRRRDQNERVGPFIDDA